MNQIMRDGGVGEKAKQHWAEECHKPPPQQAETEETQSQCERKNQGDENGQPRNMEKVSPQFIQGWKVFTHLVDATTIPEKFQVLTRGLNIQRRDTWVALDGTALTILSRIAHRNGDSV